MDKPLSKDVVIPNVLNYCQAAHYIDDVLGYSQRDAASKFWGPNQNIQNEYLDYWHFMLEGPFSFCHNDTYLPYKISFIDIHNNNVNDFGEDNWRSKISKVWAQEYPDEYTIWMSW